MSQHDLLQRREQHRAADLRREQAEPAELDRAEQLLAEWIATSELPQVEALRHNSTPRIVVLGGTDTDLGLKLVSVMKSGAAVEQTPHGQYLDEYTLREPEVIARAFAEQPDLVVLPFTIDHLHRQNNHQAFELIGHGPLKEAIVALRNLPDNALTVVLSSNKDYKPIFEVLGLHPVLDVTLANPIDVPEGSGHLAAFANGETLLDPETTQLIRECDCMIGNIVTTLGSGLLEMSVDDHGIQFRQLEAFKADLANWKKTARRIPERYRRLQQALPKLEVHRDVRIRILAQQFYATAALFPRLMEIIAPVDQAAAALIISYETSFVSDETRRAISVIEKMTPAVMEWFKQMRDIGSPIGRNTVYQAYRVITNETERQEFPHV